MAASQIQNKFVFDGTNHESQTLTFDSTAIIGKILFSAFSVAGDATGSITITQSGWTIDVNRASDTNTTLVVAWKVSDGTETAITWNHTEGIQASSAWFAEYDGLEGITPDVTTVSEDSSGASVTSQTTGTTGTTTQADTLALSFLSAQQGTEVDAGAAWTNSFTHLSEVDLNNNPGLDVASKILSSAGTVESTFSTTDAGDQLVAGVLVWKIAASSAVDDINTNEIVTENEQDVTFTTSGFAGEITTFKLVSGSFETSLTGVTSSSGAGDADIPDFTSYDGIASSPIITTANNAILARLGDGTTTADLAITVNARASFEGVEVLTAVKTTGSIYENVVEAVPDESIHYYDALGGDLLIDPDGILFYSGTGNFSVWWWNKTTGITKQIDVTVPTDGSGIITTMISPMITSMISGIIH